ncbi:MAG TPA: M10 family metallopeptidase C-terminal domain-containing protein, partial [Brevundimonas sp.]|nr:M10 family metallopeptidase C-terminal domain-containing protein [Brevundimonas sp.]
HDTVVTAFTHSLAANVENLDLSGRLAADGVGNALDNHLAGNTAANTLTGGAGADTLAGGAGADTFVFTALGDSSVANSDRITDFNAAEDAIDLRQIDANAALAGDQAFMLAGAFSGQAGQAVLTYDPASASTSLALDVNGDALADFQLQINGQISGSTGFFL